MELRQIVFVFFVSTIAVPIAVVAQTDAPSPPNFEEHVKPILRQHCLKCHGDDKQESDLNLQGYGSLLRGGSGGKVVEAGRSSQSLLFQAITNTDDDARMPPNSPPLPKEKIELIRQWIDTGLRESRAADPCWKLAT